MGWMDIAQTIVAECLTNTCPVCKKFVKKDVNYLKNMKGLRLKKQDPVSTAIWEQVWDWASSGLSAISWGYVELGPIGSETRKQRYICPKCKRQFIFTEKGTFLETVYSRIFRID